jgi:hypothetical protein
MLLSPLIICSIVCLIFPPSLLPSHHHRICILAPPQFVLSLSLLHPMGHDGLAVGLGLYMTSKEFSDLIETMTHEA